MAIGQEITDGERADERLEQLADELHELRAENAALAAKVERLEGAEIAESPRPARRVRRRKPDAASEPVSRRRMFGMLGGAAAAGAGLAVAGSALGADPAGATFVTAGAANGDALQIGGSNQCSGDTQLTSSTLNNFGLAVTSTAGRTAILGVTTNGGSAVVGQAGNGGYSLSGDGGSATAPLRLSNNPSLTGAPSSGAHAQGEFVIDSDGALFYCTESGVSGTWVNLSSGRKLVTLAAPVRVFDSRSGQPNQAPNVQGPLTFTNAPPSSAFRDVEANKDASSGTTVVPSNATTLLLNLTVTGTAGIGALVVYAHGASQPAASSINWTGAGLSLANAVTTACDTSQHIDVAIVAGAGASANFLVDVIGYYL